MAVRQSCGYAWTSPFSYKLFCRPEPLLLLFFTGQATEQHYILHPVSVATSYFLPSRCSSLTSSLIMVAVGA
jgi:hypothetical protein